MKNFDSRAYSINDFVEWDRNGQLTLNPSFQRRSVWSDTARSYLMDTIVRGKPIPKVFIRQIINPTTKKSVREVVDGQQRLKTILSFVSDGFKINPKHHSELGGLFFSQLDKDIQENILTYEISTDLLINMSNADVLDIFSRLNSYSVILNTQEKINASHFGAFKTLTEKVGHKYYEFWKVNKILTDNQILRMGDVSIVADLYIAVLEGIKSNKQIKNYFDKYEKEFPYNQVELEDKFDEIMNIISRVFSDSLANSEFRRVSLFYSLFTVIYHFQFGLKNFDAQRRKIKESEYARFRNILENIESIFLIEDKEQLSSAANKFVEDSRRATTDASTRERRAKYIIQQFLNE
jgi:hypothetical protein